MAYVHAFDGPEKRVDPFTPPDVFETSPVGRLDEVVTELNAAWAPSPPEPTTAPAPFGRMPGGIAAGAPAMDAAVHAWDLTVATGQALPLSDDLAERLIPVAEHLVPPRPVAAMGSR